MSFSIPEYKKKALLDKLRLANVAFQHTYPGLNFERQPVHTVYGGAQLFKANTIEKLGHIALDSFHRYANNFIVFGHIFDLLPKDFSAPSSNEDILRLTTQLEQASTIERRSHPAGLSYEIYHKVIQKLKHEPIEDFRLDFEDGFGPRPWNEEDQVAIFTAKQMAIAFQTQKLSHRIGIRIKSLTEESKERSIQTLDLFLTTLLQETNGVLPPRFVIMLPKVTIVEQISTLVEFLSILEKELSLSIGSLKIEIMIEANQAILDQNGQNPLLSFIKAAKGRCIGASFGTYDFTANNKIASRYQQMDHSICDFAHYSSKMALENTGVLLADGATNIMPIGPHRGKDLTTEQIDANTKVVHYAWKKGYAHIRHSLWKGLYQGWDLNPAQIPMRYAAVYAFFLENYEDNVKRLRSFIEAAAQSTLYGQTFDDAATGQGLLNFFLTAFNAGAITAEEVAQTGLSIEEIQSRSFLQIVENRTKQEE